MLPAFFSITGVIVETPSVSPLRDSLPTSTTGRRGDCPPPSTPIHPLCEHPVTTPTPSSSTTPGRSPEPLDPPPRWRDDPYFLSLPPLAGPPCGGKTQPPLLLTLLSRVPDLRTDFPVLSTCHLNPSRGTRGATVKRERMEWTDHTRVPSPDPQVVSNDTVARSHFLVSLSGAPEMTPLFSSLFPGSVKALLPPVLRSSDSGLLVITPKIKESVYLQRTETTLRRGWW